jgi:hypothetical protein
MPDYDTRLFFCSGRQGPEIDEIQAAFLRLRSKEGITHRRPSACARSSTAAASCGGITGGAGTTKIEDRPLSGSAI